MVRSRISIAPGSRYGYLTVMGELPPRLNEHGKPLRMIQCMCDCGATKAIPIHPLTHGNTVSCGCFKRGFAIRMNTTHGGASDPAYHCWHSMIYRCGSSTYHGYHNYGGRGIRVCERWQSFNAFLEDMGPRPSPRYSIDRIDNDGNYEPGNCRWATRKQQHRNTRYNRMITHDGVTKCLTDWAASTGLSISSLRYRLNSGWPTKLALTLPPYTRFKLD